MNKRPYELPSLAVESVEYEDVISTSIIMPPHYIGGTNGGGNDEQADTY